MAEKGIRRGRKGRCVKFKWLSDLKPGDQKTFAETVAREEVFPSSPEVCRVIKTRDWGHVRTQGRIDPQNRLICPKNGKLVGIFKPSPSMNAMI